MGIMSSLESLLNDDVSMKSTTNDIDTLSAVLESDLSAADRRQIPTDQFGLPSVRKYPLNDDLHVRQAIKFFHFCKGPNRKELASNIVKRMKELKMPLVLSEKATIRKYLSESQLEGFKASKEQSEDKK
jgi:ABC-type Na+ transport system ATPase subunit NatA